MQDILQFIYNTLVPQDKNSSLSTVDTSSNYNEQTRLITYFVYGYSIISFLSCLYFIYYNLERRSQNETNLYSLHIATYENNTDLAIEIVKVYPDFINKTLNDDDEKYTPFLRASLHGNTTLVDVMLKLGADVTAKTARNENGFFLAAYNRIQNRESKDFSCIHLLYLHGVDINEPNCNGLNSLQLAAKFGHNLLVGWLLEKNPDMNIQPNPCLLAQMAGHRSTVGIFRKHKLVN